MSLADREKWDRKYTSGEAGSTVVSPWLVACEGTIHNAAFSVGGTHAPTALDVACGLGANALWLAGQGWNTTGVDISPAGLELAQAATVRQGLSVRWLQADLDENLPGTEQFDLIVICRFLDRDTLPRLVASRLAPGGWLVHTTFVRSEKGSPHSSGEGTSKPMSLRFLLEPGEITRLYPELTVVRVAESPNPDLPSGEPMAGLLARKNP